MLPFLKGVVKAQEPVCVQALHRDVAVERLDEDIVGRLPGCEKSSSARHVQCRHEILAPVAEGSITGEKREKVVDDRQDTDPTAGRQLVMNEIHRTDVVGMSGLCSVFPELCPQPSLWGIVPDLQTQLLVKAVDSFGIDLQPTRRNGTCRRRSPKQRRSCANAFIRSRRS